MQAYGFTEDKRKTEREGDFRGLHKIGLSLIDWNPLILTIFFFDGFLLSLEVRECFRRYEVRVPGLEY